MDWLLIIGLIVAVAWLWNRVGKLEQRLDEFEAVGPRVDHAAAVEPSVVRSMPAEAAQPETTVAPVPDLPELVPSWEPQGASAPVAPDAEKRPAEPERAAGQNPG